MKILQTNWFYIILWSLFILFIIFLMAIPYLWATEEVNPPVTEGTASMSFYLVK